MAANQLTIIAPGTIVRGDLFSQDLLVVEGGVQGNVVGDRVIIKGDGWVRGNLRCRSLSIELGGIVDGEVTVEDDADQLKTARAANRELESQGQKALPNDSQETAPEEGA
ncbi:MAG: polymer-forming cytoskeletal protein [Desulfarculaceae bacterium]|nr:polymer-forming cytoskeletal protein [Desulfarculaceae bacterium]MCF8073493.1 polymer-forming cytoskeletal protein [Desulfarculaceae bacterium]MCF8100360.1 polymer-forming cytoskeletal protein [Desulfarculaceae bacterium]MCF8118230.1 polymer-forming cytoskeletal protein [Desulfarculaceae bacterium]